jgi:hypothetical protein
MPNQYSKKIVDAVNACHPGHTPDKKTIASQIVAVEKILTEYIKKLSEFPLGTN